jgi:hypothetical protein
MPAASMMAPAFAANVAFHERPALFDANPRMVRRTNSDVQ